MKMRHLFHAGLAGALVLTTQTTPAQTWQTVDDYQYAPGHDAVNTGLAVAPSGTLFAAGWGYGADAFQHALVMASADDGNTWSVPLDDYTGIAGYDAAYYGVACDSAGRVYAAGASYDDALVGPNHWVVRRSADGGATWSSVDDYVPDPNGQFAQANAVAADAAGNVYVAGFGQSSWTVRKGIGGQNFTTVDASASGIAANAVFVHPTAGVFVAGQASVAVKWGYVGAWSVRRSRDGGSTWVTVDTFYGVKGATYYGAHASSVGADAHGNIYVAGSWAVPYKGSYVSQWVVRKSTDGGNSWSTVDTYQPAANLSGFGQAFVADSQGNLFVAGRANVNSSLTSASTWLVRENPGGIGAWQTVDNFSYVGSGASPAAMSADSFGHVFAGGLGFSNTGAHWLVRKH